MSTCQLMMRAHTIVATISMATAIGTIAACTRGHSLTPSPSPALSSAAGQTLPAPAARTSPWAVGKRYGFQLKLSSTVTFGTDPAMFDFDLGGRVEIFPTANAANAATIYLAIREARILSRVPGSQPDLDKVAEQINLTGCFFSFAKGLVTEMRASAGLPAIVANMYRDIGASLQVAAPPPEPTEHYATEEFDTTGQYVADYQYDRDQDIWRKRKQRYLGILSDKNVTGNAAMRVVPEVAASQIEIRLAPDGRPLFVKGRNEVLVTGAQVPIRSMNLISLEAAPEQLAPDPMPNWAELLSKTDRVGADEPYGRQVTIDALDDARIQGQTFEKIMVSLEKRAKGAEKGTEPATTEQDSKLFIGLSALFRRKPETITKAMQKIRAGSLAWSVLIDALAAASSPAAQDALIELMNSKTVNANVSSRANSVLVRTARPSENSVEALKAMLVDNPFDAHALFGLGSYSRRLRDEGKTDQARALGDLLVARLQAAQTVSPAITVLRAITNSGYDGALPYVIRYQTHEDALVRAAAVRALQSMRDQKVDGILAARMQSDDSSDVRISAMDAAQVRPPTDIVAQAIIALATRSDDPRVRYRAVELLTQWLPRRPELRSTLAAVATSDQEETVRERAKASL